MSPAVWLPEFGGTGAASSAGRVRMSFDVLAPHYRWMEFILAGDQLQRCRTAFLGQVAHCKTVLAIGEGNGRFLLECRRQLTRAEITYLDASDRMLRLAREGWLRRESNLDRIHFIKGDALTWTPPEHAFDLIVTHFFLDCFSPEQLELVIGALARAARPAATWLLADFQVPPAGFPRYRAQVIHWLMYRFFRVVTRLPARNLTVPDPVLRANHFALQERRVSEWGLLHTDLWTRDNR